MSSLLSTPEVLHYHLYRKETDMRKGYNSLSGLVRNELGKQITDGDVFIFINRPRNSLKMLLWEEGGFTLFYRRLDTGTFEVPVFNLDSSSMQINSDQLQFILKGISLKEIKYRKRYQRTA
jgi:transposase